MRVQVLLAPLSDGMGQRGPSPIAGKLRALRGGKKEAVPCRTPSEAHMILRVRAEKLEALADSLIKRAKRTPTRTTKSNGVQISAELTAALRCSDAADKIWARVQRLAPKVLGRPKKSKWDGLL